MLPTAAAVLHARTLRGARLTGSQEVASAEIMVVLLCRSSSVVAAEKDIVFWIGLPGFRAVVGALDVQCTSGTGLANCCSALRVAQMNALKLLKKALSSPANLRFEEACALARAFGFHLSRVNGSHHIFARAGVAELLNLQEIDGKAKPYQVKQLLGLVERYNLSLGNEV